MDFETVFEKIKIARKAITDLHGARKPPETVRAEMPCPICNSGSLHYSIAASNGHIHARCDTEKCISWME